VNSTVLTATVHGIVIVAAAIGNVDATVIVTPARVREASRDATRVGTSRELRAEAVAVRAVAANAATVNGGPSVVTNATAGPINRSNANDGPKGSSNSVPSSNRGLSNRVRNRHRVSQPQL
jgi:hypothetical protein